MRGLDPAWFVWLSVAVTATGLTAGCASPSALANGDAGRTDGGHRDATTVKDGPSAHDAPTPVSGCEIGSVQYGVNAPNPSDPCESCQPDEAASAWSAIADSTACGNGQVCSAGKCGTQCEIDGAVYATETLDPMNPCLQCQPGTSTTAWTHASGTSCGAGRVCNAGSCVPGCFVSGAVYAPSAANLNDVCQSCQPSVSTSSWSPVGDGTACGNGQFCGGGRCGTQCDVDGVDYTSGATNPMNACQACEPGATTSAWTNAGDGTPCAGGEVCIGGACTPGCYILATLFQSTSPNPMNACQSCQPAKSTSGWSTEPDGTPCEGGFNVCSGGACVPGGDSGVGSGSGSGSGTH